MNPWTMMATVCWVWPIMAFSAADQALYNRKMAALDALPTTREAIESDARLARALARTPADWRAIGIEPPVPVRGLATVREMAERNA